MAIPSPDAEEHDLKRQLAGQQAGAWANCISITNLYELVRWAALL